MLSARLCEPAPGRDRLPCEGMDVITLFFDQVGYFLSPLDFRKECFTFFLFRAAFKRLVFFRLFMFSSVRNLTLFLSLREKRYGKGYLTSQTPETISAVPTTRERVIPSFFLPPRSRPISKGLNFFDDGIWEIHFSPPDPDVQFVLFDSMIIRSPC
jgi:hypothetical protein